MSRLRFQESLPVMQSYVVALSTSVIALFLLVLGATARVPWARETLLVFGRWFIRGLALVAPVVFVLTWGSLPGNLPRLVRRIDPAQVNEEPVTARRATVFEIPAIVLTYVGMLGLAFFELLPGLGTCPPSAVGPFTRCTLAQSLGMSELFGIGLLGYVGMFLVAHPLWLLVWLLD